MPRSSKSTVTSGCQPQGCPEDLPADLRYVDDSGPGWSRRLWRGKFAYFDTDGRRITDALQIARINSLAIPPAYRDVWICPDPRGHLQATGRDARGRKQYRYHARWREARDATKFERMLAFSAALPKIRSRVARDLNLPGMQRNKILATALRLLDVTLIRVGNEDYARENRSYGLTTLRNRHVQVRGAEVRFRFRGKSGVEHDVKVSDRRVATILKRCLELPGQELFQYVDDAGQRHVVGSSDVNDYLRSIAGEGFTAKDYRTWAGTVFAMSALREPIEASGKQRVVEVVKQVAQRLGNTPAVCRRCYIHPAVLDAYEEGALAALRHPSRARGLRRDEAVLAAFLRRILTQARRERRAARPPLQVPVRQGGAPQRRTAKRAPAGAAKRPLKSRRRVPPTRPAVG